MQYIASARAKTSMEVRQKLTLDSSFSFMSNNTVQIQAKRLKKGFHISSVSWQSYISSFYSWAGIATHYTKSRRRWHSLGQTDPHFRVLRHKLAFSQKLFTCGTGLWLVYVFVLLLENTFKVVPGYTVCNIKWHGSPWVLKHAHHDGNVR